MRKIHRSAGLVAVLLASSLIAASQTLRPGFAAVFCGDIVTSDKVLNSDLPDCASDGIIVGASGITLDCQGHRISGMFSGAGVLSVGNQNVTIKNCVVQNFVFGIRLESTTHSQLVNNIANNNRNGFVLRGSSNFNTLEFNSADSNGFVGFSLESSFHNILAFNTAQNNSPLAFVGAFLLADSSQNVLANNTAQNNAAGFHLARASNNNTFTFNLAEHNRAEGFIFFGGSSNTVVSNNITDNFLGVAIRPILPAQDNLIYNNFISRNTIDAEDQNRPARNFWNINKTVGTNIIGGPFLGGNFWSGYRGSDTDSDGLGDTLLPYNSDGRITIGGDFLPLVPSQLDIDIKPGSDPNSINVKSTGKIPVAILSGPGFDAPSQIDVSSLTFGRTGDEQSLAFCTASAEDVNGDGLLDVVCHFDTQKAGFKAGDTVGILRGRLVDGTFVQGMDGVRAFFPGDVNGDLRVDIIDAGMLALAYGSTPRSPDWNANGDFDENNIINIIDFGILAYYYGQHA